MWRLIWKEYREKRLFAVLLAAAVIIPVLSGLEYLYIGSHLENMWFILQVAISLLLGASTYGHETAGGYVDFLYSRPLSWKRLILTKSLFGIVTIALFAIISAIVCKLTTPAQYASFVTLPHLVQSTIRVILIFTAAYVVGEACSVVLPGAFGGVLTFIGLCALSGVSIVVLEPFHLDNFWGLWLVSAWVLGVLISLLVVARFGITLPTSARLRHCFFVFAVTVASVVIIGATFKPLLVKWIDPGTVIWRSISPDGKYATVERYYPNKTYIWLVNLSTGKKTKIDILPGLSPQDTIWIDNNRFVSPMTYGVYIADVGQDGAVRGSTTKTKDPYTNIVVSPGGRYGAMASPGGYGPGSQLIVVDLNAGRKLSIVLKGFRAFWWESANQLGYTDTKGSKHIVNILNIQRNVGR